MTVGSGLPDWFIPTFPARVIVAAGQATFSVTANGSVTAGSSANVTTYTVPSGKRLFINYIDVSCEVSCLQRFQLLDDTDVFEDLWLDVSKSIGYPEGATYTIDAGATLAFKCYNNDTSDRTFYVTILGWEQTVG